MSTYKQLTRSNKSHMVAGVCGGLGEYLKIDPTLLRLLFTLDFLHRVEPPYWFKSLWQLWFLLNQSMPDILSLIPYLILNTPTIDRGVCI